MTLLLLAYLGGVLTIVSPCILPVLPFVFARADQPFLRSGLPLLVGMALMFAGVATLATVGGGWAIRANEYGRYTALALLAFVGLTLLSSRFADRVMQPVVALGDRLSQRAGRSGSNSGFGASLLLGAATGLLWAPCAGPILGLILTGAAINGGSASTTLLLLAYAAGSATSLAAALIIGGRVFTAMKRSLGAGEWIRRGLGVAVLAGVVAIALGLDTGALTQLALANTARIEQTLLDQTSASSRATSESLATGDLAVEGAMPPLDGAVTWINSSPLTTQELRGKVVLVDFWTYSCINCLRALPYVRAWAEKYKDRGLVVIGVHTPEFAFEKNLANVQRAVRELDVAYPVAVDSDFAIWRAFNNHYWPAHYFVDAQGRVRHHHFGEGEYAESERVIQTLLSETGSRDIPNDTVDPRADGVQANADTSEVASPETYVGFARGSRFVSGPIARDVPQAYAVPTTLQRNQWGLAGEWAIGAEQATLSGASGSIEFRFHARDLHLVLGPVRGDTPIRFRVTIDGVAPDDAHGFDTDAEGEGTVTDQRLYQLVRQKGGELVDRTFKIEFLDPGVQVFAFTFG